MSESFKNFENKDTPEILKKYGVTSFKQLSNWAYSPEDQKLMREKRWDYENPELLTNQIYRDVLALELENMDEEDRDWCREILWFWNHHAISCAIWKYHDLEAAKQYAEKALEYQTEGHPNQITEVFCLLLSNNLEGAESFALTITDETEKDTATYLIRSYKEGWKEGV